MKSSTILPFINISLPSITLVEYVLLLEYVLLPGPGHVRRPRRDLLLLECVLLLKYVLLQGPGHVRRPWRDLLRGKATRVFWGFWVGLLHAFASQHWRRVE